ncbi:MAG: peptidase S10 [Hyphomicrobiaceae bacterium]|nr:peptidase S10 [Hyphomicrobiaceae bacterium]
MPTSPRRWMNCGLAPLLALAIGASSASIAVAQTGAGPRSGAPAQGATSAGEKADLSRLFPPDAVSRRTLVRNDQRLAYTATAGTLPLLSPKGEISARIFFVAYTSDEKAADRPITFAFNGGPGASSAYLHLGAMGPRAINFTGNGAAPVQPVELVDNPDTWLDFTDLVFVDPVATGYSRSAAGTDEADKAFFGVDKDADAMADFVRLALTRLRRPLSPIFLAGESYGGFRAALLAHRLLSNGLAIKGVIMISPALEFSMLRGNPYAQLPLALALPSIAATHLERRDGAEGTLDILPEVERFARSTYLVHLAAGQKPDAEIDRTLARYTGLGAETIHGHLSRVSMRTFTHEYEARGDRVLSRYDGTVSVPVPRRGNVHFDPILDAAVTALTPAFTHYASAELGYHTDLEYHLLNRTVSGRWDFGTSPTHQGFAGALGELQMARAQHPALGALIAHGYTDLVTPYAVSQYLVDQLAPLEGARPVELKLYRGGHMMYLRPSSRRAFAQDTRGFYRSVLKGP